MSETNNYIVVQNSRKEFEVVHKNWMTFGEDTNFCRFPPLKNHSKAISKGHYPERNWVNEIVTVESGHMSKNYFNKK